MIHIGRVRSLVTKPPKLSKPDLDPSKEYFVVDNGMLFDYYPIKILPTSFGSGRFHKIEKSPPVISDGFVIFKKKIYKLTKEDLLRRRINVSAEYHPTVQPIVAVSNAPDIHKPAVSQPSRIELSEDANVAWEEQIRTLLHADDPQTWDWETETPAQSGRVDEDSAVQDPDEDPQ